MFGPGTTAGKIDEYEMRFTQVNGAHFLIAGNGREAWPISAAEADEFKAHYRRRMMWARWIRRLALLLPILLLILGWTILPKAAWVRETFGTATAVLIVFGIPLGFLQHTVLSDLARVGIERRLKHRITTRQPEAITPKLTPAGRFGRQLLFAFAALELGMAGLHLILGRNALAQHMRIMYRMGNGQEDWLARLTGNLAWVLQFALMLGILLLIIDRRSRRKAGTLAKQAEKAAAKEDERGQLLRQLADEHRRASGQEARQIVQAGGHAGRVVFGRNARGHAGGGDGHFSAAGHRGE